MKLTGKAKTDFEDWMYDTPIYHKYTYKKIGEREDIHFYKLTPSMQWGVYQDWARSVKYSVQVIPYNFDTTEFLSDDSFSFCIHKKKYELFSLECDRVNFESELEARSAAIEKLNEIYNERQERRRIQS